MVPSGSSCSPGPTTHFVHACTSGGPPSRMRSSDGTNGASASVVPSSVGQRSTSSSIRSSAALVTLTMISPPSAPTLESTVTETTRGSDPSGRSIDSGGSGVAVGDATSGSDGSLVGDVLSATVGVGSSDGDGVGDGDGDGVGRARHPATTKTMPTVAAAKGARLM